MSDTRDAAELAYRAVVDKDCPHDPETTPWHYHRSCERCWVDALREARAQAFREAAEMVEKMASDHRSFSKLFLDTNPAMSELQKVRAEECEVIVDLIERAARNLTLTEKD